MYLFKIWTEIKKQRLAEYKTKSGALKKIAAKIIDRNKAPKDFLNKFLPREIDIYLKLDHPNIIKVFEIIDIGSRVYIFMEYAESGDLLEYIRVNYQASIENYLNFILFKIWIFRFLKINR